MSNFFTDTYRESVRLRSLAQFVLRTGSVLALLVVLMGVVGCTSSNQYREEHVIKDLKVVFLDQESLHEEWKNHTGSGGVQFMPSRGGHVPSIKTLRGFFDFSTNTLYCPKWHFAVCGHELHHAALGQFHEDG